MLSEHEIEVKLANMKGYLDGFLEGKDEAEYRLLKEDSEKVKFVQGYIKALEHVLDKIADTSSTTLPAPKEETMQNIRNLAKETYEISKEDYELLQKYKSGLKES